ncbi:AT-rich interactive domain-containing protein 3C [Danaus plexippus plexippus]|uniref:AT-rich interactive domain-containing protein 3C n=1 Tax=Danaus plexippus plexippus TaxID=278856 RepID=A0A212EW82_DANPL|nr:AT-rich interactive domain-containing protein 3C [Danaus plexippus plexippus]
MELMDFFNTLMDEQLSSSIHSEPPKMPNFFEVDKKKLYEISDDPQRKEFLDDLFSFMQKRDSNVLFTMLLYCATDLARPASLDVSIGCGSCYAGLRYKSDIGYLYKRFYIVEIDAR